MPQNQLVQARIDGKIKAQATAALADVGLTVSDAVRILLTRIAQKKMMPMDLLSPNETTLFAMKEARDENSPRFYSVAELNFVISDEQNIEPISKNRIDKQNFIEFLLSIPSSDFRELENNEKEVDGLNLREVEL